MKHIRLAAGRSPRVTRSTKEVRAVLRGAFSHALAQVGESQAAVARWLRKDVSTIRRWQAGTVKIDVESIMRSGRLWAPFLRCLVILERKARRV